ncbi:holliday junction resolvase [Arthrobacter phage Shambre1]|uniref:Holliday junction resolvase n=1 Tax=Arthrobacter phage Shambre1 TaxID=2927284 RepID=A0A977PS11_9CAUD|nr:holliday junction resolvase [Arthrobacter phage Shambre1]UXE04799.1 holliday junction resolvase [Arthrobacter phage Shambre1]
MPSPARNRAKGTELERKAADYLKEKVSRYIDRRAKTGAKDKGDLVNVHHENGADIAVECKYEAKMRLAGWAAEAETERINLGAIAGVIIHKRHGKGAPADQWVTMTLADFAAILTGKRDDQ